MTETPERQLLQGQDTFEDINTTPTNPPFYETRSVTGPTLDPNRNNYFTPPVLADEREKRKASQDRVYSTSIGKKDLNAPAEKKVILDLNSSTLEGAVGGLNYREGEQLTVENDSDSLSTDSSDSDSLSDSQVGMDLDATFAELLEDPDKRAAVDRVFKDIGSPPVSDWVKHMEISKASQIQEAKHIADMATVSYDPKNLIKPVLKLSDPKLVLGPGRFPPISNPNLPGPSSANNGQSANDHPNPPFNNQGQSGGGSHPPGMPNSSGGGDGWDNSFNPNNKGNGRPASAQNLEEDAVSVLLSVGSNIGGLVLMAFMVWSCT